MKLVRVNNVKPLHEFIVHVSFSDGSERDIDLEKYLHGPAFREIRENPEVFRSIRVTESKTIGWGEFADIDPDTLYHNLTPAWAEETEMELAK